MATGQTAAKHLAINLIHTLAFIFFFFQNKCPEVEELVFSHFVICNDTQETLRFGQVDTDENILLASLHSHQYSWRSHRSPQVFEKQADKQPLFRMGVCLFCSSVCVQLFPCVVASDGNPGMFRGRAPRGVECALISVSAAQEREASEGWVLLQSGVMQSLLCGRQVRYCCVLCSQCYVHAL